MVGERVLSRFTISERLGSGGFGTVYRAWDERLQRPVAVKVIEQADGGRRVLREAQAAARLGHPNIVTLYELAHDGERAFLVTELVEGSTLRRLSRAGMLSDRDVALIGADAAEALAHAHSQGVVHRDVKPENVLVTDKGGRAKLVDFGIARLVDEQTLTASGDVLGTLAYMAPEQAEGRRPGPGADVYSLALTLYEAWTGEHPLLQGSAAATARAIGEPVTPLDELRPDLPKQLSAAVDAALEPEAELRPEASELADALSHAAPELGEHRLPALAKAPSDLQPPRRGRRRPRVPLMPLALLFLCALVILGTGVAPTPWILTVPIGTGLLALARPRLALALAAAALAVWLATAGSQLTMVAALAALAAMAIVRSGSDLHGTRGQPTLP